MFYRVMSTRTPIPAAVRTRILIANTHSCCVCQRGGVQLHHINGDNSNHSDDNLAALCLVHHDKATAPRSLTAALTADEIRTYKRCWEESCKSTFRRIARSRTAFYMVDYKNAERIRQMYLQLNPAEHRRAAEILRAEFLEEDALRKQYFDLCTEPNTKWNSIVEQFLEYLPIGDPHPGMFKDLAGHPLDPMWPTGFQQSIAVFAYYDLWCQIMIRAILTARDAYDLDDLTRLVDPDEVALAGRIVSFRGSVRGRIAFPQEWQTKPLSKALLTVRRGKITWRSTLELKTHYVYSVTAAVALGKGTENGLLVFRGINSSMDSGGRRTVDFTCTPLIIGNGVLKIPEGSTC